MTAVLVAVAILGIVAILVMAISIKIHDDEIAKLKQRASLDMAPTVNQSEEAACVDCAKDTADRLERAAEEANAILEKLECAVPDDLTERLENAAKAARGILAEIERAEQIGGVKFVAVVESAILGYHTEIRRLSAMAEGIVARPIEPLFDKRGERIIIKLKTRDFMGGRRLK